MIDGRVLLLQDQDVPSRTEIIEDSDRIASVEKAYDTAAERVGLETFTVNQDEVPAIRSTVSGYYEAIGVGNLQKAYSYLGPTARDRQSQASWIKDQARFRESLHLQGTRINPVELGDVDKHRATRPQMCNGRTTFPTVSGISALYNAELQLVDVGLAGDRARRSQLVRGELDGGVRVRVAPWHHVELLRRDRAARLAPQDSVLPLLHHVSLALY